MERKDYSFKLNRKHFPLLCSPHERPENPFSLTRVFNFQCSQFDLIQSHLKPGSNLCQFNILVRVAYFVSWALLVDMVSKRDIVLVICKCNDPPRVRFGDWKEVFENVCHSLSQSRTEIMKEQVGICFWHGSHVWNIMSHDCVKELKVCRWSMRQMADSHSCWNTSHFIQNNQVRDIIGSTGFHELFNVIPSSVDSLRIRKNQFHFLRKQSESRTGVSCCRDNNLGILDSSPFVLVIFMMSNVLCSLVVPVCLGC